MKLSIPLLCAPFLLGSFAPALLAQEGQESLEERLDALEAENAELRRRIDVVAGEVERIDLGDLLAPPVGGGRYGYGPAASKIYSTEQGLSLGGYGEFLYQNLQGSGTDTFDGLRAVLYVGYKFDERWLFNSEIEFEHASTSGNVSGSAGEVSVEFAQVEYSGLEELNARAGILLVPMGWINELHEPTTFLSANRPRTEQTIIPSTWRNTGAGIFGSLGGFDYRSYVLAGLVGEGFSASNGLRGGRDKGNRAQAESWAWVTRFDWTDTPGLIAGGSGYVGNSGQDSGVSVPTYIWDLHADWRWQGFRLRGLAAVAELDNVDQLNAVANGGPLVGQDSIGERMVGWYGELGYDLLTLLSDSSRQQLTPFVRWEEFDTQASVPSGFASNPANDRRVLTTGVAWQPIDQVIVKLDYEDWDDAAGTARDQWNFAIGYIF
jgi:hypothetical protein